MTEPAPGRFDVSRVLVYAVVFALVATAVGAAFLLPRKAPTPVPDVQVPPDQPWTDEGGDPPPPKTGLFDAPIGAWIDVPAVERSGLELRTSELLGRFLVVDFVFTSCSGTCPQLQAGLQKLQAATPGADDLRLISLSVDPATDTPERLATWADALGAHRSRWLFLRVAGDDLRRLMKDGMKVPTPDDIVMHSSLYILVDREGRVRGRYAPLDHANWLEVLQADLAKLRAEAPR